MNGKTAFPFLLAFTVNLTGLLYGAEPAPRVRFDQTAHPPDVPANVLIGENFTFRVRFRNDATVPGAVVGFGPFIDLVLDAGGANVTKNIPCTCDGMTFVKANLIGVNGGAVPLVSYQSVTAPCSAVAPSSPNHPFGSSGVLPLQLPAGAQLVTIELPFGSFDPTQPEAVVEVTAKVSPLADASQPARPLKIYARGGFRYGADALDDTASNDWPVVSDVKVPGTPPSNQQTDPAQWATHEQTTPTVMIVSKRYLGPENETATGPNFIQRYEITLDIAKGQTVNNLTVIDFLLSNVAYRQFDPPVVFSPTSSHAPLCFASPQEPIANQPNIGAANWLTLSCASLTGGDHPLAPATPVHDATAVFEFFIPEKSADGFPILEPNFCTPVSIVNGVEAEGSWTGPTPQDPCDNYAIITSIMNPDPPLDAKCMAIQKTAALVSDKGAPGPTPGDTLQYTLNFQISDFKTAGNLKIQDFLSDGQTLVPGSLTLLVRDQCGTTPANGTAVAIPQTAWTQITNFTGSCRLGEAPPLLSRLDIDVSAAMAALAGSSNPRHGRGILTGGHAFSATPLLTVPATGTITFQTVINDQYTCPVTLPHDRIVDKDDLLSNHVTLTADILGNGGSCSTIPNPIGVVADDGSGTIVPIVTDLLEKKVYAVTRNGVVIWDSNSTSPLPDLLPRDDVTFRLKKTIPSSDAEQLTIQDWLPLPTFLAAGSTFDYSKCGLPAVGKSCFGPANDLLPPLVGATIPAFPSGGGPTNSITFDYGTFQDPANLPHTIDVLFTREVTNTPFADGLYMTNEAQERESNTFGLVVSQVAIAQVHVRQPALRITKGVVATSAANAVFSPAPAGPVAFQPPGGGCPRFSGAINSTNLASAPIHSDVSGVDANDVVTFAIVVENSGGAAAYDIRLRDLVPQCYVPNFNTLCVTDGNRNPIAVLPLAIGPGNSVITVPGPLPGLSASAPGANIVVLTFDAQIVANVTPGCCDNTAQLESYASTQGGPNFVAAGFGGPFQDAARSCVVPTGIKSIKTTSEAHTPGTPLGLPLAQEQLAIGEIVRYHLDVVVPETTTPSTYQIQDLLPAGLSYVDHLTVASLPAGVSVSNNPPTVSGAIGTCSGGAVTFDFGSVTNTANSAVPEIVSLEFDALVCNVISNQNNTPLDNRFTVLVNGQAVAASNSAHAVVVEPNIVIAKDATPNSAVRATYTITLTNNGTATAFDVHVTDALPACLTNIAGLSVSVGATNHSTSTTIDVTIPSIPVNGTVTIHYTATVTCSDCSKSINTATATWTSLPGPIGAGDPTTSPLGLPGSPTGERDGSGGRVNNYLASATASLCCMLVTGESASCTPNGTFLLTVTATNYSHSGASAVIFTPPPGVTLTTYAFIENPPLPPGGAVTTTEAISGPGAVPGTPLCFNVAFKSGDTTLCNTDHCLTLPACCVAPPPGLVAWYPMDEAAGATTLLDIAGGNNATPAASPVGAAQAPQPAAGTVNGAISFPKLGNGLTGATVSPSAALVGVGSADFTIDAWVKFPASTAANKVHYIVNRFDTVANKGYALYVISPGITGNERLELKWGDGVNTSTVQTISPIAAGQWYHVAATFARNVGGSALDIRLYVNGAQAGQQTGNPPNLGSLANFLILEVGSQPSTFDEAITIDELEIFNRALTAQEVQRIFSAGAAGKCRCMLVTSKPAACNSNVTFTTSFDVTNLSNTPASAITFVPPAGLTITPSSIPLSSALFPGGSTNVSVTISGAGAVSGANICFTVVMMAGSNVVCRTAVCTTLPSCCAAPPAGMVAWWPLDEGPLSTFVADIVGNNNGTTAPNFPHGFPGKVNNAAGFCGAAFGTPLLVTVHDSPVLNFGTTQNFSIDAWINASGVFPIIVDKLDSPTVSGGYRFYAPFINNGHRLKLAIGNSEFTGTTALAPVGHVLGADNWCHVAATVDRSGVVTFYVNGTAEVVGGNTASVSASSSGVDLLIGGTHATQFSAACEYALDEVEIFNRALTQAEVQSIFSAGSAGKCASGTICVSSFQDLNLNGVQDPFEPSLSGWIFTVKDQNNKPVGTITAPGCLTVLRPGKYTIVEQVLFDWIATTPNPQTVTVETGQTTNVAFGNRKFRRSKIVKH